MRWAIMGPFQNRVAMFAFKVKSEESGPLSTKHTRQRRRRGARTHMSSSPHQRWQKAGRCRSFPPCWGPSPGGTARREGRRTWWRRTHPWSPFYTETHQNGALQITAGLGGCWGQSWTKWIKLTLILWILGPRFSFFVGTSTHTCMPLLSYLFTQLSVDKHCLLKSAKTASSGKILDILDLSSKNKLWSFFGRSSSSSVHLRRLSRLEPLPTCI